MIARAYGQELLRLARTSIDRALKGEPPPSLVERPHPDDPSHGVFVTLKIGQDLRGCIGTLSAEEGIPKTVSAFAREAAFRDPRFPPLTPGEWPSVSVEVSVLTPPRLIPPEEVEPGRHGIILELGARRGLLLPQVATEWGFTREQFLAAVSQKAGLPDNAWKLAGAKIYAFEAEVFGEEEGAPPR
ncbi:MAG TPA: AmmeMemoRadiSam system protein A [Thermoanaerobaculia bacterium]|nr:AmmeMemoRadiSam system protein A [Thermoanaerobaculia bacterium]